MGREQQLAEVLVGLADSLADDIDPVVLVERLADSCVRLTGADAVGVMVASSRGDLRPLAVTDEQAAFLEFFQLQADEGPCLDCFREGRRIDVPDLEGSRDRWPEVAPYAIRHGYGSLHGLPLRVHRQTVGAVNLLLHGTGGLSPIDLELAQALADVTAVALVNWNPEPLRPSDVSNRVQAALAAKAAVDIATGMLAQAGDLTMPAARAALHDYAGRRHQRLVDVAHALVRRSLTPDGVLHAHDAHDVHDVHDAHDARDVHDG
ncbi:transcriptional regulator [Streptomyces lucensis JCM 4490]|uniref:Transcriptional regulator n=1 Tax=Streptomyces lucensis JCM 4490 TaxID=1306176 RepID=A0A918J9L0_9ACTN|nr:GAF and ANTAR domain-containing protein [Streptomyces lucensis]GGW65658.1 transcriptional regulator [Streptomyces lucensis JCM 4490]